MNPVSFPIACHAIIHATQYKLQNNTFDIQNPYVSCRPATTKAKTMFEPAQLVIIGAIVAIFIIAYIGKGESTLYCVLIAVFACIMTAASYGTGFISTFENIFALVNIKPLVILLCFSIIISVVEQQSIFEYFAVRIIRMTKDNIRLLFYLICLLSAFFSGFLDDVSVAMIFIPLMIRTAQLLLIDAVPFITGISFSIIVGNLLTAFSAPSTILISELLGVNTSWFFSTFIWLFLILIGSTLLLLDLKQVRKMKVPDESRIKILIEIFDSKTLIADKKKFVINIVSLILVFVAVILVPAPLYIIVIVAVLAICTTQSESLGKHLKKADWNLILFILAIFMVSACLSISGMLAELTQAFSDAIGGDVTPAVVATTVVVIAFACAIVGSFFSKTAAIIIFSTIINDLLIANPEFVPYKDVLVMAVVVGAVLGGNIIPQASSHMLKTLSITKEKHIDKVSQKMLTKNSIIFFVISMAAGLAYTLAWLYM
jgi:Na+/H+ antiporter NhaD/arsenite permease-like protein